MGGCNRVRGPFEKHATELGGNYPLHQRDALTGRFDGTLRVRTLGACNGLPSRKLPTYFVGDHQHLIVPRQLARYPVQAVYEAVLSPDCRWLLLIVGERGEGGGGASPGLRCGGPCVLERRAPPLFIAGS